MFCALEFKWKVRLFDAGLPMSLHKRLHSLSLISCKIFLTSQAEKLSCDTLLSWSSRLECFYQGVASFTTSSKMMIWWRHYSSLWCNGLPLLFVRNAMAPFNIRSISVILIAEIAVFSAFLIYSHFYIIRKTVSSWGFVAKEHWAEWSRLLKDFFWGLFRTS